VSDVGMKNPHTKSEAVSVIDLKELLADYEGSKDHHFRNGLIVVHLDREGVRLGQLVMEARVNNHGHLELTIPDPPPEPESGTVTWNDYVRMRSSA
jgi:hypothetical protein